MSLLCGQRRSLGSGGAVQPREAAGPRDLETWLVQVSQSFNILSMDGPAFRCWARLMHRRSETLYEDAMIAAIARVLQLTVVTRNIRDFQDFGVELLNPFEAGSWT